MAESLKQKAEQRRSQRRREMLHKYGRDLDASDGAVVVVTRSLGGGRRSGRIRRTVSGRPHADFAIGVRDAVATTSALDILCSVAFKRTRDEVRADLMRERNPLTAIEAEARIARKIVQALGKLTVSDLIDHTIAYGQYGVTRASGSPPNTDSGARSREVGDVEEDEEDDIDFDMDCASAAAGAVSTAHP